MGLMIREGLRAREKHGLNLQISCEAEDTHKKLLTLMVTRMLMLGKKDLEGTVT